MVTLEFDADVIGVTLDGRSVADRPLSNSGTGSPLTLTFWNPPTRGFDLTLDVQGSMAPQVTARASTPGLPPIPGMAYRGRPPDTMTISTDPASIEQDSSTLVSKSFTFQTP